MTQHLVGTEIVQKYLDLGFRIVAWPTIGDAKGPREPGWPAKQYTIADYHEGYRVGILTGTEVEPGRWLHDVDIDWAPGSPIAQQLLPTTGFVFGRPSKKISHCFYLLTEPQSTVRYEDLDRTCVIELRGTKNDGSVGLQTMAPPSQWSQGTRREALAFVTAEHPALVDTGLLQRRVLLSAIGMLLAKHLGHNGFGHDARLCWAGFLLRAEVTIDELVLMGEGMSRACNNLEVIDVRRTVESTAAGLASDKKKVKGGPALAKLIGKNGKAVLTRINEWLGRGDFYRVEGHIVPKNQGNITRAIELLNHELSYDEFSDQLLIDHRPLEDPQWIPLNLEIEREFRFSPPVEYFKMVIKDLAWRNSFHPVKDYLDALSWDETPRLDTWIIDSGGAENTPYVRAISSIMLIAAVRRIYHPGAKYDEMVVWESPQGANKSSAAQALCPNPSWFSDDLRLNLQSQQLIEATLGKWIVEASDLAGKRKTEIEQLKAMLSRQVDGPARLAYAHFPVSRPRQFILIGTTNSSAYLTDPTGARRFWPMTVQRFDLKWIVAHRDQLWAEARVREARGESIRLREELWPDAGEQQEQRREVDPWEDLLRRAVLNVAPGTDGMRRVVTALLWDSLGVVTERRDRVGALRIAEIMHRLGFKRTRVRPAGEEVQVGYVQVTDALDRSSDETPRGREPGEDDVPF